MCTHSHLIGAKGPVPFIGGAGGGREEVISKSSPTATEYSVGKKYSCLIPPTEINSRPKFERKMKASRSKRILTISLGIRKHYPSGEKMG